MATDHCPTDSLQVAKAFRRRVEFTKCIQRRPTSSQPRCRDAIRAQIAAPWSIRSRPCWASSLPHPPASPDHRPASFGETHAARVQAGAGHELLDKISWKLSVSVDRGGLELPTSAVIGSW